MENDKRKTYSIEREFILRLPIGEGSYGVVYDAFDSESGQDVAIKFLKPEYIDDSVIRSRFKDEAVVAASVDHPSGLPVYGFGTSEDGRLFYVMKKVQGRTLESLLRERGTKVSDQAWLFRLLYIFLHVCEGVAAAHERGIIHRDIKPENIIVNDQDFVTVLDWGLARRCSPADASGSGSRTVAGAIMGSPGYMSPEQAKGDSARTDPRTDVFSLGVILYRIMTDVQPFEGETPREAILRAIYRVPQDPRRLNPWVSRRLAAICCKAIEKNPDRRYADAQELARDMHAYLEGRDVSVARLSRRERIFSWARRSPGRAFLTTAIGTILLLAFIIVGGQIWLDENMVEKAFETIALMDAENDSIVENLKKMTAGNNTAANSETIEHQRQILRVRLLLNSYETLIMLEDVIRLRYIYTSPETVAVLKSRLFNSVRQAMDMGEPGIAKVLIMVAREYRQSLGRLIRLSPQESERLDAMEKEVDASILEEIRKHGSSPG